jgi:hypothetical protein
MQKATTLAHRHEGEAHRLSPLEAFVAWVANLIATITGMKRRKVFPTNWKDHWHGLRELEWYRDQILAFAARHVLAGGSLDDRTDFQLISEIPEHYGICPRTPKAMNHRFILQQRFRLDPNKFILRHIQRIARREGIALILSSSGSPLRHASHATSPGFAEGGLPLAAPTVSSTADRRGRWRAASSRRVGGGIPQRAPTHARGPPRPPARSPIPASLILSARSPPFAPSASARYHP